MQALNSLCNAGTLLARNLFCTVQEIPAYHDVSLQFLSVWEEVSKATAGASAAVKTETLMLLQEILNSLEMSSDESNMNEVITNSFQVILNIFLKISLNWYNEYLVIKQKLTA